MTSASPAATDDRGEYRIIARAPGTYLVAVEGAGAISGVAGGASVIVLSADPTLRYPRSPHVTVSRTDIDGAFSIRALPPGDYVAVAVTRLPALILSDPVALEQLSAVARRVRLDEWDRQVLQLRVRRW